MRQVLAALMAAFVLCCSACAPEWKSQDPVQLRERANALRMEAAGLRKDAKDYSLLVQMSRDQLKIRQIRLDYLVQHQAEVEKRIEELDLQKEDQSQAEAERTGFTIARYADQRDAYASKADEEGRRLDEIRKHIEDQRWIRDSYIYKAEQREQQAQEMEACADELSGG